MIFLLLFIYQTCISHSVSSCLSCSAGTIVGAVMSIVASCLIQIFNSSCSTVSYMNALKPRFLGETCLPGKFRLNPAFQYADILCIWMTNNKKSISKEKCLPLLLLINNCLGKEHTSMVKRDSPWVMSSVVFFLLRWLSKGFSYKAVLASSFLVQSSFLIICTYLHADIQEEHGTTLNMSI